MERQKKQIQEKRMDIGLVGSIFLAGVLMMSLILFVFFCMDHLMHSDMSAEVILSKLLADEGKLITKNWYYSTEIRIVYSQLIMMPLFLVFHSYELVKQLSVLVFYVLLVWAFHMLVKRFQVEKKWEIFILALLFAPVSNEYLDMLLIGCFYTAQMICTYLVLSFFFKEKANPKAWLKQSIGLGIFSLILGLSGLRYLASLFLPLVLSVSFVLFEQENAWKKESFKEDRSKKQFSYCLLSIVCLFCSGIGFCINKFYLASHYSFDTTSEVAFVPLSEVPERFLASFRLMLEFVGYTQIQVLNPRGILNAVKLLYLLFLIGVVVYLWKNRKAVLTLKERMLLYFFIACFLINWYMLVFTNVLLQYRYWLPVYCTGLLLLPTFFRIYRPKNQLRNIVFCSLLTCVMIGSLYGELWQDVKYNDCEKRYAYMEFLQKENYDFGYATFWNASVSEYLSNGKIHVASLGLEQLEQPYEWLQPKWYYQKGYHTGKCFLLLANSEAAGMEKGDFTIMQHPKLVYRDEYYSVYEDDGGMYITM